LNRNDRQQQDQHAARDHAFRSERIVEPAAQPRAEGAGDRQQDPEAANLNGLPAERAGGVDAPERKQRHQAVRVDHIGEKKRRHRFPLRQLAEGLPQLDHSLAHGCTYRALGRIIRGQQEHRQHEHEKPDAGERTGNAIALMRDGIETEQRFESQ
jgi:hypothetical protein